MSCSNCSIYIYIYNIYIIYIYIYIYIFINIFIEMLVQSFYSSVKLNQLCKRFVLIYVVKVTNLIQKSHRKIVQRACQYAYTKVT